MDLCYLSERRTKKEKRKEKRGKEKLTLFGSDRPGLFLRK
jgi:hypothetical protein